MSDPVTPSHTPASSTAPPPSLAAALAVLAVPSLHRWLRGGAMRSAAIAATGAGLLTPLAFAVQCPASALPLHSGRRIRAW